MRANLNIVIKPADKGGAVVVMDSDLYANEGFRQLLNPHYYREIERPLANETVPKINAVLNRLLDSGFITDKQFDYLEARIPDSPRSFYLLPKVHKDRSKWPSPNMPEGRPIVADCGSETYRICEFIDYYLKPLATRHSSYLKDTYDFIHKIRGQIIPPHSFIVTGDVTALYTNMEIDRSIAIVREVFFLNPDTARPDNDIIELLEICLRVNDFEFDGRMFVQQCGTAMGKKFAPNLANIYMLKFDYYARTGFKIRPLLFYRFLDDIFFIWTGTRSELEEFNVFLNTIIPGIKITLVIREEINEFLDTRVYKSHRDEVCTLNTRVYFKTTDTHQLLHGRSFHPRHTTRGILKSQIIRFKRICSNEIEFDHACRVLFAVLRTRGYSRSLFRRLKSEIWCSNKYSIDCVKKKATKPIFPLVNYYDPIGAKIMRDSRRCIDKLKILANITIVQANKIHRNLARMLTRSHFLRCVEN